MGAGRPITGARSVAGVVRRRGANVSLQNDTSSPWSNTYGDDLRIRLCARRRRPVRSALPRKPERSVGRYVRAFPLKFDDSNNNGAAYESKYSRTLYRRPGTWKLRDNVTREISFTINRRRRAGCSGIHARDERDEYIYIYKTDMSTPLNPGARNTRACILQYTRGKRAEIYQTEPPSN